MFNGKLIDWDKFRFRLLRPPMNRGLRNDRRDVIAIPACREKQSIKLCLALFLLLIHPAQPLWAQPAGSQITAVSESLDVDPITGTSVISIPIQVPQGRGGIQPNINILYNSSSPNGPLGPGWIFELGAIERNPKEGTPKYDTSDRFIFMQSGGREELADSGNGIDFMVKIEGGFSKYKFENNAWTVLDKKGIKYFFGADDDSRTRDPADTSKVFKWNLSRVEDLHGNYMTVSYLRDGDHLYPNEINYTGNTAAAINPYAKVAFTYEPRTDETVTYIGGFRDQMSLRLKNVEVRAEDNLLTKYAFTYNNSQWLDRSILENVTQYGSDGTSALPATLFTYSGEETQVDSPVNLVNYPSIDISDNRSVQMMDMNKDGLVDIIKTTPGTGNFKIYFNTSTETAVSFAPPVDAVNSPSAGFDNLSMHIIDFNADGLLDVLKGDGCPWYIFINNGVNGYDPPAEIQFQCPAAPTQNHLIQFMDMNGDTLIDVLQSYTDGNFRFFGNNGANGLGNPVNCVNSPPVGANSTELKYADFNADGMLDIIHGTSSAYKIYINNGVNGYETPKPATNRPGQALSDDGIELADINGDGLTDIIRTESTPTLRPPLYIYYNNGKTDFEPGVLSFASPELGFQSPHVKLTDMNNDGSTDALVGTPSQGWYTYLNLGGTEGFLSGLSINFDDSSLSLDDNNLLLVDINGDGQQDLLHGKAGSYRVWVHRKAADSSKPNVLVKVGNGMGGETILKYTAAEVLCITGAQYKAAFNSIFFNTIKTVIRKSLLTGQTYQTHYEFKDCIWDKDRRELLGFEFAKVTDAQGNYSETDFLQQDTYRRGRIIEQRSFDAAGNLINKAANTWSTHDITQTTNPQVKFVFLSRKDNFVYDGDAFGRRTAEEYFYEESPQLGSLTKVVQLGEVDLTAGTDIGADKRTVETTYLNNTSDANRLIGLPKQVVVKDNAGTVVRQSWFYYDNQALEELPLKGLLTKKEDWNGDPAGGAANPKTQYVYDTAGNLSSTTDAMNNTTAIAYDPALKLFPLTTTNAINHQVVNEYYGINGVPLDSGDGYKGLWGQLKSTTDPNNQQGKRVYDVFGRKVKSVSPLDSIDFPTAIVQYIFDGPATSILSQSRINHGEAPTIDSIEYYDGLGRLVQTKTKSETTGQFIVSGQTEYDSRGLPVKKYLPVFTSSNFNVMDPIDPAKPHTAISYDAAGRVLATTNPDGSSSNVIYDDWTTTAVNESGHQQKSYADAYGRLIKKEEYLGADGRDPAYPFSQYTLYASTLYEYDSEGNLVKTTDAHNNITTISYDKLGRKIRMNDPDMGLWQYGYDLNGNLSSQIDAKGKQINFTYDALNRLVNKTDGLGLNVNYTYDDAAVDFSKGRLTKAQYTGDDTRFLYDSIGREIQSIKEINQASYPVGRSYDALSRLVDLDYPDLSKVKYLYNGAGQIEKVSASDIPPPTPPLPPPTLNEPSAGDGQVSLTWSTVSGAASYQVKYGTASGNYTTILDPVSVANQTVTGLTNGTTYYFAVVASDGSRISVNSNEKSATPEVPPLAAPVLNNPTAGDGQVSLTWSSVTEATSYQVKYGTTAGGPYPNELSPVTVTNQTVTGLTNGTTYYFVVTASDAARTSVNSNEKSATPQAPPPPGGIIFDSVTSSQADDVSSMNLSHTVNSGNNRVLVVAVSMNNGGTFPQVSSMTFAGQSLTLVERKSHANFFDLFGSELWYLLNPPSGANTLTANFNTSVDGISMGAMSLNGVAQAAPEAVNSKSGSSSNPSLSLTTLTNNAWVIDSLLAGSGTTISSAGSGQAQRYLQNNSGDVVGSASTKEVATAGATAMSWNFSTSRPYAIVAASFAPAGGSASLRSPNHTVIASERREHGNPSSAKIASSRRGGTRNDKTSVIARSEAPSTVIASEETVIATPPWRGKQSFLSTFAQLFLDLFTVKEAWAQSTLDYTTFSENDPTSQVTTTSDCVSYNNIETATTNAYVYENYSVSGDFEYTFDAVVSSADTFAGPVLLWGHSPDSGTTFDDWSDGVYVVYNKLGSTFRAELAGPNIAAQLSASLTLGQRYYFTVTRSGNTVTAKVYSDSARANLLSTLNVTETTQSFSYLYGFSTRTFIGTGKKATGDVCHLVDELASPPSPPSAPVLNAPTAGDAQVSLSWNAVSGATGYKVKYGTSSGSYGTTIDVGNVTSHTVTSLTNGTAYYFAAVAYNAAGDSANSNEQSATPQMAAPSAPTLNSASPSDQSVTLDWNASATASGYKVKYGTSPGSYGTTIDAGNVTSHNVTGLTNGTTYYFVVTAYNAGGESGNSNEKSATPQVAPPSAPVLNSADAGDTVVDLTWEFVPGGTNYKVKYGTVSGTHSTVLDAGSATNFQVTGLTNNTTYYFVVTALNAGGESPKSNELSAIPVPGPVEFIKDVDYNATGQITRIEFGNGNVTTYTYDPLALRLTNLRTQDPVLSTIQDLSYTYDRSGNILTITDSVNTDTQTFGYDALGRLVSAQGSYGTKTYIYDEVGNILEKDGLTYSYGGTAGPHAVTALSDGTTFGYDANGNMTSRILGNETTEYLYDAENRLIEVKKDAETIATYEYDGDGGRTKKVKYAAGQVVETTKFIGSLYEERNGEWTTFIYLGDQRLAAIVNGQIVYYHANHLGSTNLITDTNGTIKELIEYEPYGKFSRQEKFGSSEDFAWHYFTAQRFDAESGLYYYQSRYYDPSLGRFITPDTIVPYPSNPQSLNRYSYAGNNPVSHLEDGHGWFSKILKSFFKALVQAVAYVVLSPIITPIGAGALVGFIGGGITDNGWSWKGALIGAAVGGLGGAAFGTNGINGFLGSAGPAVGLGLLAVGAGYSAATGGLEGLAEYTAGVAGAIVGVGIGNGINKSIANAKAAEAAKLNTGTQETLGNEPNTPSKSLDVDGGAQASDKQALSLREKRIINDQEVYYEDRGLGAKNYDAIDRKGGSFLKTHKTGTNFTRAERSQFVKFTADVPADNIPGSFARYTQVLNGDGRTVAWYKDTYGAQGQFIHRRYEVPGPPRYVYPDGSVKLK